MFWYGIFSKFVNGINKKSADALESGGTGRGVGREEGWVASLLTDKSSSSRIVVAWKPRFLFLWHLFVHVLRLVNHNHARVRVFFPVAPESANDARRNELGVFVDVEEFVDKADWRAFCANLRAFVFWDKFPATETIHNFVHDFPWGDEQLKPSLI